MNLELSEEEALVLYDWVATLRQRGLLPKQELLVDDATASVLWDIESQLEPLLLAIVQSDYSRQVEAARRVVLEPEL